MATHLAEILKEEMDERGWTVTDLVMNMGPHFSEREWGICQLSWEMFMAVRSPGIVLGDQMADQLEAAFGVDRQFFLNVHEAWRKGCEGAMSEPVKIAEDLQDLHRICKTGDGPLAVQYVSAISNAHGCRLIERVSAAEAALALAKEENASPQGPGEREGRGD